MAKHAHALAAGGGVGRMSQKAIGIFTFILSMVIIVTVVVVHFAGADIAALKSVTTQFYMALAAYVILLLGAISRAL